MLFVSLFTLPLLLAARSALAIEVVVGSPCYDTCGGGLTHSTDVVCSDGVYTNTQYGQKMAACLLCESTSLAVNNSMPNGGTTDEYWFMCNMKYTLQVCVADSSTKTTAVSACSDECKALKPILDTYWLDTSPYAAQYDYCTQDSGIFPADAPACAACLRSRAGGVILGNFAAIMATNCKDQPLAQNGQLLTLGGRKLLDSSTVASATTSGSATKTSSSKKSSKTTTTSAVGGSGVATTGVTASFSASTATSTSTAYTSYSTGGGIGHSAAIGIWTAVALAASAIIVTAVSWILRRRRRSRQQQQHSTSEMSTQGGGSSSSSVPLAKVGAVVQDQEQDASKSSLVVSELGGEQVRHEAGGVEVQRQRRPAVAAAVAVELDAGMG